MTQEVSEATHGNVDQQLKKLQEDREKAKGASLDPMKVIQGYVPKNFVDALLLAADFIAAIAIIAALVVALAAALTSLGVVALA